MCGGSDVPCGCKRMHTHVGDDSSDKPEDLSHLDALITEFTKSKRLVMRALNDAEIEAGEIKKVITDACEGKVGDGSGKLQLKWMKDYEWMM